MRRLRFVALILVAGILGILSPDGPARAEDKPDAATSIGVLQQRHLANGLTVLVQEDHRAPLVATSIRYVTGSRVDPEPLRGLTEVTVRLMRHKTKHVPAGGYDRFLSEAGASDETSSTWATGVLMAVTVPANRLSVPLWLWSDQMGFFDDALTDADVASTWATLAEQRRLSSQSSGASKVDRFAHDELYPPGHPYRDGDMAPASSTHVDRAAVIAHHDAWLDPSHAILAIVGDVVADEAFAHVERYFGTLPRGSSAPLPRPAVPALKGETQLDVAAGITQGQLSIRWPTPRALTTEDARLDIVAHMFHGRWTAWLFWELVDKRHIATGVFARQRSHELGSEFEVTIDAAPGHDAKELLAAFDAAMADPSVRRVTPRAIDIAGYEVLIDRAYSSERMGSRSKQYADYMALVGDAEYDAHDFARYGGITPDMVQKTIDTWLPRDKRVVVLVTP